MILIFCGSSAQDLHPSVADVVTDLNNDALMTPLVRRLESKECQVSKKMRYGSKPAISFLCDHPLGVPDIGQAKD